MKIKDPAYVRKLRVIGCLFLLPAMLLILFTTVIPVVWNIYLSFGKWDGISNYEFVGLENYMKVFSTRVAKLAIKNSCIIAVVATGISMILGLAMSLMIFRVSKLEGAIFRFLFYGPVMLPMTVVGLLFTFILSADTGLLNNILRALGLGSLTHAWLATETLVVVSIGAVQGWRTAGSIMMLTYTAMVALPNDIFEEAKLEGASYWQEIRYIIMPLIRPTFIMAFSLMSMWSFKTYDIVTAMTGGGPGDLSTVAPLYIIEQSFRAGKFGFAAAVSVVFAFIILIIIAAIRKGLQGESYEF